MAHRPAVLDLIVQKGRDKSLRRRHPWLLSGGVASVGPSGSAQAAGESASASEAAAGAWVRVLTASGECLGVGHYSPASAIRVRLLSFGKPAAELSDESANVLIAERIAAAVARRTGDAWLAESDAVRLVNAEGDGLPGLTADRYGGVVVVKFGTPGMALRRELVATALRKATGAGGGIERADAAARREGFRGEDADLWGSAPDEIEIVEGGRRFTVDLRHGQKTGFYLDQRDARSWLAERARGRRVLDLFSYTGGFGVAAACGGASEVVLVESAARALERARAHLALNAPDVAATFVAGDAFEFLRPGQACESRELGPFDMIVVDPPPLARRRRDVDKAARAYKDLIMHALRNAAPGAEVLVFSCSHHVGPELLRQIVFGAALDARRSPRWLRSLEAPVDHPVSIDHPEGRYLNGAWLQLPDEA